MPNLKRLLFVGMTTVLATFTLYGQQTDLRSLAAGLSKDIASSGKRSIAVVDFTDLQGKPTELGRYLAEEFAVGLTRARQGFEVIDRTHLKTVLAENKLATTGLIDPATAKKLGQIVGADALVTGSMTPFSESVRVTVKVITTDTARIIAADATDLPKTTTIAELLGGTATRTDPPQTTRTPTVTPSSSVSSSSVPPPSSPVVVDAQFQFQLLECTGIANSVTCSFRITNRGQDRNLILYCGRTLAGYNTRAFDDSGNESYAETCALGNRDSTTRFAAGLSVNATVISGVPVTASALFPRLGASASTISLVTLVGLAAEGQTNISASFRSVPIKR
jgi:TolB-like protein